MNTYHYNIILINVDELWLKGKNRHLYFKALRDHIRELLGSYHTGSFTCTHEEQRIVARSETPFSESTIRELCRVPGIHSVLPAVQVPVSFEAATDAVLDELGRMTHLNTIPTFKVETRRSSKRFPMTSMEFSSELGGKILEAYPYLKVSLKAPELVVEIRILKNHIYAATRKLSAMGGLPAGTSGHLVSLISGGFDSPVASYLMAKRGCRQTFIFFYAYPFVGEEVKDKILRLIQILGKYQRHSRLVIVPFGEVQDLIAKNCDPDYRTVLFRKAMVRAAALLAQRIKANGLLTGDALGQVSSQTIWNIPAVDRATRLPIFRPLVGFNKIEILELAKKIGTHAISIIPHDDACSLFAPKHPVIKPSLSYMDKFDKALPLDEHLRNALKQAEVYNIALTGELTRVIPNTNASM